MKRIAKILALILAAILSLSVFTGCGDAAEELFDFLDLILDSTVTSYIESEEGQNLQGAPPAQVDIDKDGSYTSPEDVAAYINLYGKLPSNFITKSQAEKLGWDSSEGNLHKVAPGKSIGGDRFGNYEGLLPKASGRVYYECDVNYSGGYRGPERIVFSNDGLVYYTADHYETFTLLYKEGVKQ